MPLATSPGRKFQTKAILSRRPSTIGNPSDTQATDTFEHILQVTSQHDTIMTYYYLDENNKVRNLKNIIQHNFLLTLKVDHKNNGETFFLNLLDYIFSNRYSKKITIKRV